METGSNSNDSMQDGKGSSSSGHKFGNEIQMDEKEALKRMNAGIQQVDNLLNNYALMLHKGPVNKTGYKRVGQHGSNRILSLTDLKTFAASFEEEPDISGIRRTLFQKTNNSILFLPLSLISSDKYCAVNIPAADYVKDALYAYKIVISIHQICSNSCFEVPHIDDGYYYNGSSNKDEFLNSKDLLKLKKKNRFEWEKAISKIEFECLRQQIYQVVSDLDLQLDKSTSDQLADQVICFAVGWNRIQFAKKWAVMGVKKLFGDHHAGNFIVQIVDNKDQISKVRCHIGSQPWGDYHGIGMDIESIVKVKVFWVPKAQASDENDLDSEDVSKSEYLASLSCSIVQGLPLEFDKDESLHSSFFIDCAPTGRSEYHKDNNTIVVPDTKQAHISLTFDHVQNDEMDGNMMMQQNDNNETVSRNRTKKLDEVVKLTQQLHSLENDKDSILETEVYTWGDNTCNCLGVGPRKEDGGLQYTITEPDIISFYPFSCFESVHSIECSSCHTLLLTKVGSVYSCGDGSDGQLGHNSLESSYYFRLIQWFNDNDGGIIITQIAVGSDETSSHSAAIDSNHNLYTWGKAIVCGHADKKSNQLSVPKKLEFFQNYHVLQVSCGGGFSIVRATNNSKVGDNPGDNIHVFSWGLTARGRLGLGRLRPKQSTSTLRQQQSKIPWCQCSPTILATFENEQILDVSAGAKHALAVTSEGEVYAWGSNSAGECSVVAIDAATLARSKMARYAARLNGLEELRTPTLWDDVWLPRKITFFGNAVKAKSVYSGGIHSAALDSDGKLYTWGGGGHGDCLGHGDVPTYEYGIRDKADASKRQFNVMSGHLRPPKWAIPRMLQALNEYTISDVSLGAKHGAAITSSGRMYVWGDHTAKPPRGEHNCSYFSQLNVPTHACENYLRVLRGKFVQSITCGSDSTFCITQGSIVGKHIGTALLHEGELSLLSNKSADSDDDNETTELLTQNNVDCVLIAGGRRINCHKIILASRSPVLMDMILMEERYQEPITEIIVPGIQHFIMKDVLRYIYTDNIDLISVSTFASILNLLKAAKWLKVGGLVSKCERLLSIIHGYETKSTVGNNATDDTLPLSTLPFHLSFTLLQADNKFADVRIIIRDGKSNSTIHAHECILRNASEHFRNLLNCNSSSSYEGGSTGRNMKTIELPGTYAAIVRLISFLYTGVVTTSTGRKANFNEDVKVDLQNAVKFQLDLLKAQCESAIEVIPENSFDVLLFAIEVESTRLRLVAMNVICKTMQNMTQQGFDTREWKDRLVQTLHKCPSHVKDELFEMVKETNGFDGMTSKNRKEIALLSLERSRVKKEKEYQMMVNDITNSGSDGLSISRSLILLVLMVGYILLQNMVSLGASTIFVVNTFVLICTAIYLFQKIR